MSGGRPRTMIGTYGDVYVMQRRTKRGVLRYVAETRYRDLDGRLPKVTATAGSKTAAIALLKQRLMERPGYRSGGALGPGTPFGKLADLWLADLDERDLAESTRGNYADTMRLHVRPAFENLNLGEITTMRVEWFLKSERAVSFSRASTARTVLNLVFAYALRHAAMPRNPVDGTSPLTRPKDAPQALTLEQIAAIRAAAAAWRTQPGLSGPNPDGQVRDITEVLLGTGMRPGEVLGLRPCDVTDGRAGMVVHVNGAVVYSKGKGAVRQDRAKTPASIRSIAVPEFAAVVLRRRLKGLAKKRERTIFANRTGKPLSPYNVRRTFREFLKDAGLQDTGISLRWYRRTAATVIARGMGSDAAATFLGHTSKVITEGHYIEPDKAIDRTPSTHLEVTLRAEKPDRRLLDSAPSDEEDAVLDEIDQADETDEDDAADEVDAANSAA